MTLQGMILGTAAYMSPEQAKGRPADQRSDVWAFGCVLYEMLTARRAFDGEDVSDTLAAVLRGEPNYAALPTQTPPAIRTLIKRCLERDRRRRVANLATALFVFDEAASLSTAMTGLDADALAARTNDHLTAMVQQMRRRFIRRRVVPAVFGVLVLAIGAVSVALNLRPSSATPRVARFSISFEMSQQGIGAGRPNLAISNDGSNLVYIANRQLFLRPVSAFLAQPIPALETGAGGAVHSPAFSPDDRSIAYYSSGDAAVKRVAIVGGASTTVCSTRGPFGLSWHRTGVLVALGTDGIVRCPSNGGEPQRLITLPAGEEALGPQLLPGDDALLFTMAKSADGAARWEKAQVVIQSLSSGDRRVIVAAGTDGRYLPSGHLTYAVGGTVFAVPFDISRREVTGDPVPVIEGVRRTPPPPTGFAHYAISSTGTLMYLPGPTGMVISDWALAIADRAGTVRRLEVAPGPYMHVRASRDGSHLAVGSESGGVAIVWIYRVDGSSAIRRLTQVGQNRYPIWFPDGQRVAFQSNREGDFGLFAQRIDGTGAAERLTTAAKDESHTPESISPDGKHLLFTVVKGTLRTVSVLSLDDKRVTPYGNVQSQEPPAPVFSPDGRWVAYASTPQQGGGRTPNRGVFVQPFPATGAIYQAPLENLDFHPVWHPKGLELFYIPLAAAGQVSSMKITADAGIAFGKPVSFPARVTAQRASSQMRAWDVLPDGSFVGLINPADSSGGSTAGSTEMRVVINWFEELKQRVPVRR